MDPKQTTPGATGSQGGQEGQRQNPVFSPTGTLSTGANVSRTMNNLNNRDGATYGGMSFSKQNFDKIDPGSGDIILTPSARSSSSPSSPNSRRNIIIIAVIVAVLVIIGIVAAVVLNSGSKSSGQRGSASGSSGVVISETGTPGELFANYLNYLVFGGQESTSTYEDVFDAYSFDYPDALYAERVIAGSEDVDRIEYLQNLDAFLNAFIENYNNENSMLVYDDIHAYFYDYGTIPQYDSASLLELYNSDGLDGARAAIENEMSGDDTEYVAQIQDIKDERKNIYLAELGIYADAENARCNLNNLSTCSLSNSQNYQDYINALSAFFTSGENMIIELRMRAMDQISSLIEELYGDISNIPSGGMSR